MNTIEMVIDYFFTFQRKIKFFIRIIYSFSLNIFLLACFNCCEIKNWSCLTASTEVWIFESEFWLYAEEAKSDIWPSFPCNQSNNQVGRKGCKWNNFHENFN
jgi:hypothetical protein